MTFLCWQIILEKEINMTTPQNNFQNLNVNAHTKDKILFIDIHYLKPLSHA